MLAELKAAGLTVTANGGKLYVAPSERLTPALRESIKAKKAEILRELETSNAKSPSHGALPLDPAGARVRRERLVLAMLAKRTALKYALAFEEGTEHVAVTIGTRDGRFTEMSIPRDTWKLEDFMRLTEEFGGEVH